MSKNMIRWARVTKAGTDAEQFAVQQVEYLGKVADGLMVFPYGIHGNVPADSRGLMFSVMDNANDRAIIGWTPKTRPTLADGEAAFYHPPTDAYIIWRSTGKLEIVTGTNGTADIEITAANVKINGNLDVTGDFNVDGTATLGGAGGDDIARKGDAVAGGVITGGSSIHKST